jgi:hypothetical protein
MIRFLISLTSNIFCELLNTIFQADGNNGSPKRLEVLEITMSGDTNDRKGGLTEIIFLPHRKHSHIDQSKK